MHTKFTTICDAGFITSGAEQLLALLENSDPFGIESLAARAEANLTLPIIQRHDNEAALLHFPTQENLDGSK